MTPIGGHTEAGGTRRDPMSSVALLEITSDSTAHTQAEEALRRAEARVRVLLEAAPDAIVVADAEGRIALVNARAETLFGYAREEMVGQPVELLLPTDLRARHTGRRARYQADPHTRPMGSGLELRARRKDGRAFPVEVSLSPLDTGGERLVTAVIRDITARKALEQRQAEDRFRALVQHASDIIAITAADGAIGYVSPSIERVLGHAPGEVLGQTTFALLHPEDVARAREALGAVLLHPEGTATVEARARHRDGSWRQVEASATNLLHDPGVRGIVVNARDITERTEAAAALRASEEHFRATFEQAAVGLAHLALDGRWLRVNRKLCAIVGYGPDDLRDLTVYDLLHPEDHPTDVAEGHRLVAGELPSYGKEKRLIRKDGAPVWVYVTVSLARTAAGDPAHLIVVVEDITGRKAAAEALRHQALHDALTDLPNRTLLQDRLAQALRSAQRDGRPLALLLLDLDRFKEVNDTFGHPAGDRLLRQVGRRLRRVVRAADTVARLGGDEFAVLLPATDTGGATAAAEKIRRALEQPVGRGGYRVSAAASIGIALYPAHGTEATTLLQHADVAMYVAKRTGGAAAVYDPTQDISTPNRLALLVDLRGAIARDELVLHYQPKVDLATGRVARVEALVRWQHPRRGLLPPAQFIPLAEQTGLMGPLTLWVLGEALRQCARWRQAGLALGVNVNLSMANLHDPALPEAVAGLLQAHGVAPADLRLEVTESAMAADMTRTIATLERLATLGVHIAVDDYGTGYSSLAYLKRLPVDELKIDKGFVRHLATDETDATIVRSTIGLGHNLGLRVVAEGVEDHATLELLRVMGADAVQGYYVSRPLPPDDLERWARADGASWATRLGQREDELDDPTRAGRLDDPPAAGQAQPSPGVV